VAEAQKTECLSAQAVSPAFPNADASGYPPDDQVDIAQKRITGFPNADASGYPPDDQVDIAQKQHNRISERRDASGDPPD
jgi:hypothetical protein